MPRENVSEVAPMLKAIEALEGKGAAQENAEKVIAKLMDFRNRASAQALREGIGESLTYLALPRNHWTRIRTNNPLERMGREISRRTRVVGNFQDGRSALMLVSARLGYVAATQWVWAKVSRYGQASKPKSKNGRF